MVLDNGEIWSEMNIYVLYFERRKDYKRSGMLLHKEEKDVSKDGEDVNVDCSVCSVFVTTFHCSH